MEMYEVMNDDAAEHALPAQRSAFIRNTYLHLAMAILAFVGIEALLFSTGAAYAIARTMLGGKGSWLIVMLSFMGISWLANMWANSDTSKPMQYLGLGLYVIAEAIIFVPLLFIATAVAGSATLIMQAGIITLMMFGGLTAVVFLTRKDFSFLAPILTLGGFIALGVILCNLLFGFTLGTIFSAIMVMFASVSILYNTSNALYRYRTDQYVAASLSLFASIALLFWYVLRIFIATRD